jgi:hypothetical protein
MWHVSFDNHDCFAVNLLNFNETLSFVAGDCETRDQIIMNSGRQ